MSLMLSAGRRSCLLFLAPLMLVTASAQSFFSPQQGEYSLGAGMVGEQVLPSVAISTSGGYVVWQDNATDGDGLGIAARALDNYLSPIIAVTFRVNQQVAGDQENPTARLFRDGSAIFVWQGGPPGRQDVFARILSADRTFLGDEFRVNTYTIGQQGDASVATLQDGGALVVWSSHGQDGSLQGVFGQRLLPDGRKAGPEFMVNETTAYNQRSPAVAALSDGDFVITWVSEQQRFENSVDIYTRRYAPTGEARGGEFLVNSGRNLCANPAVCDLPDNRFFVAWSERDLSHPTNNWQIAVKPFESDGESGVETQRISSPTRGKRYAPKLAQAQGTVMVVWTSDWQDGSFEGIFGRFVHADGTVAGDELRVNTTTVSRQVYPTLATDGDSRFLVGWAGFTGLSSGHDLFAQRYSAVRTLAPPAPPFLYALDSFSLMAAWPELSGFTETVTYLLYVDDSVVPLELNGSLRVLADLDPGSSHSVRLAFKLGDGSVSPKSASVSAKTWGRDTNFDGLPDDWQTGYWGVDKTKWPKPQVDSDNDGASNLEEFLAGTNPTDGDSVLRTTIVPSSQGLIFSWNSEPGCFYQVQSSTDLEGWLDLGGPRFAVTRITSFIIPTSNSVSYYRIIRIR
ncbi:MAG: thrombospondin type 3 repeat-containing protein [Limisphaerales bacterium]